MKIPLIFLSFLLLTAGGLDAANSRQTLVTNSSAASEPAPVTTEYGLVGGVAEKGLVVFRGIPFAVPPVGKLRWRGPQPVAKWDGVQDATKFAPHPYRGNGTGNVNDDCLYLNIWTPAKHSEDHVPVLVWICGVGVAECGASGPGVSGEHFARKGVVLASINNRVGALGFREKTLSPSDSA